MARNTKQTIPFAQQQLLEAIDHIKVGGARDEILPKLEAIMQQLQTLATHDHLTGALNRLSVLERIEAEIKRSQRTQACFAVAVLGIDDLPGLMEQFGQDLGKRSLQVLTNQATQALRSLDSFGRIDLTEFVIVMPSTSLAQGMIAVARLQQAMLNYAWKDESEHGQDLKFNISAGLAAYVVGDTPEMLLQRGRKALFFAQQQGVGKIAKADF